MISVNEIEAIIREQEDKMHRLLRDERIIERELPMPKSHVKGVGNIIMGPRRCGKSVLAFMLSDKDKFGYINFDDERLTVHSKELNKVLEAIYALKGNVGTIVFDEIQEVKGWERFASRIVDSHRLILTGSNAKMLSRELSTYMTGRHVDHTLFPFSFREFLSYNNIDYEKSAHTTAEKSILVGRLKEYLHVGGFPLAVKAGRELLADMYKDIVERDVIQRYNIRNPSKLSDIARYLLSNTSSEISYSKLRGIFDIDGKHTVQDWIGYLEKAYWLFKIERFSFKLKESMIAPKKVYGIDTGLVNSVSQKEDMGRTMENAVAIELIRRKHYWKPEEDINYWKDHSQREVDFLVRKGRRVLELIQVTYASDRTEIKYREIASLVRASDELKCRNLSVISWDYEGTADFDGRRIAFVPLWKWLLRTGAKV